VATFRTSGNVVFGAQETSEGALAERCESALKEALGFEVDVLLRSAAEVRAIARFEPFSAKELAASKGKLQVVLLPHEPGAEVRKAVLALATDEDRLLVNGREVYWLPSGGISDSAIDMAAVGRAAGTNTIRTKGTMDQVAAKFFDA
jgi:uncharacterized protein (DUF1697 family)